MVRSMMILVALTLGADALAEDAYTIAETPSTRFPDADVAGPSFDANLRVEVLVHDGDRLRVRDGDDYGWIAASAVTASAPDPMSDPAIREMLMKQMGGAAPGPEAP